MARTATSSRGTARSTSRTNPDANPNPNPDPNPTPTRYRKIHLSRVLGITSESDVFSAGDSPTTFRAALPPTHAAAWAAASPPTGESDGGSRGDTPHVGLLCCFDLRFSGILRQYTPSGSHGQCDVLFAPSAFLDATGVDHWDLLVRRAALDTQTFVVAPNVAYRHDDPTPLHGRSLICDPWGRIVAQCGAEGDAVVLAEVDPRVLAETRTKLPIFELARRF
jgi:predicted amidohydrolase